MDTRHTARAVIIGIGALLPLPAGAIEFSTFTKIPFILQEGQIPTLAGLVEGLFFLSIGVGAALAVIMLSLGGLQYMMSDVVTQKSEARGRMVSAVVGLLLLLLTVTIFQTINTDIGNLTQSTLQKVGATGGGGFRVIQKTSTDSEPQCIDQNKNLILRGISCAQKEALQLLDKTTNPEEAKNAEKNLHKIRMSESCGEILRSKTRENAVRKIFQGLKTLNGLGFKTIPKVDALFEDAKSGKFSQKVFEEKVKTTFLNEIEGNPGQGGKWRPVGLIDRCKSLVNSF